MKAGDIIASVDLNKRFFYFIKILEDINKNKLYTADIISCFSGKEITINCGMKTDLIATTNYILINGQGVEQQQIIEILFS